jgi:hypothetical protein
MEGEQTSSLSGNEVCLMLLEIYPTGTDALIGWFITHFSTAIIQTSRHQHIQSVFNRSEHIFLVCVSEHFKDQHPISQDLQLISKINYMTKGHFNEMGNGQMCIHVGN